MALAVSAPVSRPRRFPKYCRQRHRSRADQAFVEIRGKRYTLGAWGSPESWERYHSLEREWAERGGALPEDVHAAISRDNGDGITVVELISRYLLHCATEYRLPPGAPADRAVKIDGALYTRGMGHVVSAMRPLRDLHGKVAASTFGPRHLKAIRDHLLSEGLCRKTVNSRLYGIRRMFKWAKNEELLPKDTFDAIRDVEGISKRRMPDPEKVKPVPDEWIEAARPLVSRQVRALIDLQLLTAARPGELVGLRRSDIDTTGKVWVCRPRWHKTAWTGKDREILFGPQSQVILAGFFVGRAPDAPLFSPKEAEAERYAACPTHRRVGQKADAKQTDRSLCDVYSVQSYRKAIARACDKSHPLPTELRGRHGVPPSEGLLAARAQWRSEHRWHPNQLRHNAATRLRAEFGLDTASTILGHSSILTTLIYAERDEQKARDVMAKVG